MYTQQTDGVMQKYNDAFLRNIRELVKARQITARDVAVLQQAWENRLAQDVQYAVQKHGTGVSDSIIETNVTLIMDDLLRSYQSGYFTRPQLYPQQQFMGYGQPAVQQSPFAGAPVYAPTGYNGVTQAPATQAADAFATSFATMPPNATPRPQSATPVVAAQQTPAYIAPTADPHPDQLYGNKNLSNALGSMVVSLYRTHEGQAIRYVMIGLRQSRVSLLDVMSDVFKLYRHTSSSGYYFLNVLYTKAVVLNLSKEVFLDFKERASRVMAANDTPYKYLQGLLKIINSYNRGDADAIDKFLTERFNRMARWCLKEHGTKQPCRMPSLTAIVALSDKDSLNDNVKSWYKSPRFEEAFQIVCNTAIRNLFVSRKVTTKEGEHTVSEALSVLLPTSNQNVCRLLNVFSGFETTEDMQLVDITSELVGREDEFANATDEEKRTNFGEAGKLLMGSVVVELREEQLFITNIPALKSGDTSVSTQSFTLGGYTQIPNTDGATTTEKPNPVTCLLEDLIVNKAMAGCHFADMILRHSKADVYYRVYTALDKYIVVKTN